MSSNLQPFDYHDADPAAIEDMVSRFGALANRAIDLDALSSRAFDPAVANWSGVCAPELRAAPRPVQAKAMTASSELAWAGVALQLWADRVRVFNRAVSDILADIESARGDNFGARGHDGDPPTDDQIAAARNQFLSDQRALYRYWVDLLIASGADQVATMLDKGPTPETLAWATSLGALAATPGAFSLFQAVWQHDADAMSAATEAERLAEDFVRDGKLSDADLKRLHELLRANDQDPVFAYAFMNALGPHRLLELTADLGMLTHETDPMRFFGDIDTGTATMISLIQDDLATAFGTASRGDDAGGHRLSDDWVGRLLAAGQDRLHLANSVYRPYGYQALGVLLSSPNGSLDPDVLARIGNGMLAFERDNGGSRVWEIPEIDYGQEASEPNGLRLNWVHGYGQDAPAGFDPVNGLLVSLTYNTDAARTLLAPASGFDESDLDRARDTNLYYLLNQRTWLDDYPYGPPADDVRPVDFTARAMDSLGDILVDATTRDHDPVSKSIVDLAVFATYDRFERSGDAFGDSDIVAPSMRDSMGTIASYWMPDLHAAVASGQTRNDLALRTEFFLADVARDPDAHASMWSAEIANAATRYNQAFADGQPADRVSTDVGKVLGAIDFGQIRDHDITELGAVTEPPDQLIGAVKKLGDKAIGAIPVIGTVNDLFGITDEVEKGVKEYLTGDNPDGDLNRYAGRVDKLGESGIDAALQAALDRHPDVDRRYIPDARRAYDDGLLMAKQDLAHRGG